MRDKSRLLRATHTITGTRNVMTLRAGADGHLLDGQTVFERTSGASVIWLRCKRHLDEVRRSFPRTRQPYHVSDGTPTLFPSI
jgi:hypothetical protein